MISTADLMWIAGFLEGEGSFIVHAKSGTCIVKASQVQLWPLKRLQSLLGGKIYAFLDTRRNGTIHSWNLVGRAGAGAMMTIYSFLSPRRKEQVRASLAVWRGKLDGRTRTECPRGHNRDDVGVVRGKNLRCGLCRRQLKRSRDLRLVALPTKQSSL